MSASRASMRRCLRCPKSPPGAPMPSRSRRAACAHALDRRTASSAPAARRSSSSRTAVSSWSRRSAAAARSCSAMWTRMTSSCARSSVARRVSSAATRPTIRSGVIRSPNRRCSDGKAMSPTRWTRPPSNASARSSNAQIRSTAWSTAKWVGARNSTRCPCRKQPSTIRATTSVLPVPGGPQMNVTSQASACSIASRSPVVEREVAISVHQPLDIGAPGDARRTLAEDEARGGGIQPARARNPVGELFQRSGGVVTQLDVDRLVPEVGAGRDAHRAIRQDRDGRRLPPSSSGCPDQRPAVDIRPRPSAGKRTRTRRRPFASEGHCEVKSSLPLDPHRIASISSSMARRNASVEGPRLVVILVLRCVSTSPARFIDTFRPRPPQPPARWAEGILLPVRRRYRPSMGGMPEPPRGWDPKKDSLEDLVHAMFQDDPKESDARRSATSEGPPTPASDPRPPSARKRPRAHRGC